MFYLTNIRRKWVFIVGPDRLLLLHLFSSGNGYEDLRIFDYLNKNRIVTINHQPYSPDMAPCDFYLFGKLNLQMKGKRYADVDAIQRTSTAILNDIPKADPKVIR